MPLPNTRKQHKEETKERAYHYAVIGLVSKLAEIDGPPTEKEYALFRRIFVPPGASGEDTKRMFFEASEDSLSFEQYAMRIMHYYPNDMTKLKQLLTNLVRFAVADGPIGVEEMQLLRKASTFFGLPDTHFFAEIRTHILPASDDPFSVLNISKQARQKEVKDAYRKAMRTYHPDHFSSMESPGKVIAIMEERLVRIQDAYDDLRKRRGFM